MSDMIDFNSDAAKALERVYLTPDVVGQRARVLSELSLRRGEAVLDVGVGPGLLAYDMAMTVGDTGNVGGIDIADAMLAMTGDRCKDLPQCDFRIGNAMSLPFDDGAFDALVSTQVYEYVPDMDKATAEAARVLKPGGRAVILDTAWDSLVLNASDRGLSRRVLEVWDEHLAHPNLPAQLAPILEGAGFNVVRIEMIPMFSPHYQIHSYAAGMLRMIMNFVSGRSGISEAEAKAWYDDLIAGGERGDFFFCLNRYMFLAVRK